MSFLTNKSKIIVEKDYTEQLIFSNKMSISAKNKFCIVVIGVLFSLFIVNIANAMSQDSIFLSLLG